MAGAVPQVPIGAAEGGEAGLGCSRRAVAAGSPVPSAIQSQDRITPIKGSGAYKAVSRDGEDFVQ